MTQKTEQHIMRAKKNKIFNQFIKINLHKQKTYPIFCFYTHNLFFLSSLLLKTASPLQF